MKESAIKGRNDPKDWFDFWYISGLLKLTYISFEYALWKHGLINEIPASITMATTKKTRFYKSLNTGLDEFYLISLGKRSLALDKINFLQLRKNLLKKWLVKYPEYTQKLINQYINCP